MQESGGMDWNFDIINSDESSAYYNDESGLMPCMSNDDDAYYDQTTNDLFGDNALSETDDDNEINTVSKDVVLKLREKVAEYELKCIRMEQEFEKKIKKLRKKISDMKKSHLKEMESVYEWHCKKESEMDALRAECREKDRKIQKLKHKLRPQSRNTDPREQTLWKIGYQ